LEKYGDFPQISQVADMEMMVPVPPGCTEMSARHRRMGP
jgi:hypothetical protein